MSTETEVGLKRAHPDDDEDEQNGKKQASSAAGERDEEGRCKPIEEAFLGTCRPYCSGHKDTTIETMQCWLVKCASKEGCQNNICTAHGWGDGCCEGYGTNVRTSWLTYNTRSCPKCDKHYCPRHYDRETYECTVCSNKIYANASLGAYNYSDPVKYCIDHKPVMCGLVIKDDDDDDDDHSSASDSERSGEAEGDASNVETCYFMCCTDCIDDHKCGDDPHLYL